MAKERSHAPASAPCDHADLRWEDGPLGSVPFSVRYADPYYARTDGLAEAQHVFLDGNDLPRRWRDGSGGFTIAELGFGTGLNFLAARRLWRELREPDALLEYVAFEIAPLDGAAMARAHDAFPAIAGVGEALRSLWPASGREFRDPLEGNDTLQGFRLEFGDTRLTLIVGDARGMVSLWPGRADAWFLDGFAPSRNPALWEPSLLAAVARRTRPGGTAATYSAAGAVRRGLSAAGFQVTKTPGFGAKREMIRAVMTTSVAESPE